MKWRVSGTQFALSYLSCEATAPAVIHREQKDDGFLSKTTLITNFVYGERDDSYP